jgi:DNA-binding NtrC family response regulator
MARSIMICVTDDLVTQQKVREFGDANGLNVHCYSSQAWSEGLEDPSFRATHQTEPVLLKPGTQSVSNVIPFPAAQQNSASASNSSFATMDQIESAAIQNAIAQYRGNLTEAAKALGIGRATLYRKVKQYNIDPSLARGKKAA